RALSITSEKTVSDDSPRIVAHKKGGPRYPLFPLPLLPSGPGGVHSCCVTRDHKHHAVVGRPSVRPRAVQAAAPRRERDSNPRYLTVPPIPTRAPAAPRSSLLRGVPPEVSLDQRNRGPPAPRSID